MVGQTLNEIRTSIEGLASADGQYRVVCARTGERPVPSDGLAFPDRETAAEAARLTEQYRATLRRYDPQLPCFDPIVSERPAGTRGCSRRPRGGNGWDSPLSPGETASTLIEFCHQVAAAVFETLSDQDYGSVETAVTDAYLERAETVTDRDRLCLTLLESIAIEVDDRLDPTQQADLLTAAAERLPEAPTETDDLLSDALSQLEVASLLDTYTARPHSIDLDGEKRARSRTVLLQSYAFEDVAERLPTLPLALALLRCEPEQPFAITAAIPRGTDTWHLELAHGTGVDPQGLASISVTAP